MAQLQTLIANPFALMMSPEDVLKAVEDSAHLSGLVRRICRPLDKPVVGKATAHDAEDRSDTVCDD